MNYYEHHLGDYMRDTAHLSILEDGTYRRLLDAYYIREKPLPADLRECCKLCRAVSKPEREAVAYVLREFFELREDGHHQPRADAEISRFQDKQRKARASADARWAHRSPASDGNANAYPNAYANASPDAMRTHSDGNANDMLRAGASPHTPTRAPARPQSPVTSNQTPTKAKLSPGGRGSRLSPDWSPGDAGMAFAAKEGLSNGRALAELERFRDYWTAKAGQDASKVDWQATWRQWVRKSIEFSATSSGKPASADVFEAAS